MAPHSELHVTKQMGLDPVLSLLLCPKCHGLCGHRQLLMHVKVRKKIPPKRAVLVQWALGLHDHALHDECFLPMDQSDHGDLEAFV